MASLACGEFQPGAEGYGSAEVFPGELGWGETIEIDGSTWLALRCFAAAEDGRVRFAHSAPWHIEAAGGPLRPRWAEVQYLIGRVESEIARNQGVLPEAALDEYRQALSAYREIAERASR